MTRTTFVSQFKNITGNVLHRIYYETIILNEKIIPEK